MRSPFSVMTAERAILSEPVPVSVEVGPLCAKVAFRPSGATRLESADSRAKFRLTDR